MSADHPTPSARPSPAAATPADLAALSFEDAMAELEAIVRRLETGQATLEQSIGDYERGVLLKRHCEARLNEARLKVERISIGPGGQLSAEPFER